MLRFCITDTWQAIEIISDQSRIYLLYTLNIMAADYQATQKPGPDSRINPITSDNVIESVTSRQLTISRSTDSLRIPTTILLRSDHDPSDLARYVDWCWVRYFITAAGYFISNIAIVLQTTRKHSIEPFLSCVGSLYIFIDVNHMHIPVTHGMCKSCWFVNNTRVREMNWSWRSSIGTHKWRCHTLLRHE